LWNKHRTTVEDEAILHATMQLGTWIYKVKKPLGSVLELTPSHLWEHVWVSNHSPSLHAFSCFSLACQAKLKVLKEWKKKDGL
jgi:hypothetical protein